MRRTDSQTEIEVFVIMWNVMSLCRSCLRLDVATAEVAYTAERLWLSIIELQGLYYESVGSHPL